MSCTCRCLGPVRNVQFSVDAGGMGFDGTWSHDELLGNLLIGSAESHEMENFQLPLA